MLYTLLLPSIRRSLSQTFFDACISCLPHLLSSLYVHAMHRAGDTVTVLEAPEVKDGTTVKVLPYLDDVANVKGDLIDNLLR